MRNQIHATPPGPKEQRSDQRWKSHPWSDLFDFDDLLTPRSKVSKTPKKSKRSKKNEDEGDDEDEDEEEVKKMKALKLKDERAVVDQRLIFEEMDANLAQAW